jgi:hypothetical protein
MLTTVNTDTSNSSSRFLKKTMSVNIFNNKLIPPSTLSARVSSKVKQPDVNVNKANELFGECKNLLFES